MAKDEEKDPIEQLQLTSIVDEIRQQYVPAESLLDCDEMLTIGTLRIRMGAVPMFGSQQSDPLVYLLRLLERGTPSFTVRNMPGSGPVLLLKRKTHMPTPAERALQADVLCLADEQSDGEYTNFEEQPQ